MRYDWPGNVRELQNVLFRAALCAKGPYSQVADVRVALPAIASTGDAAAVLLEMVDSAGEASATDVIRTPRDPRTAVKRAIRRLVDTGVVVAVGRGKVTRYRRPSAP